MLIESKDCIIETEQKEGCLLTATVTFSKNHVQALHRKALKNINKEISIPGFRKGKVPDDVVLKKYGNHVEQEWKESLLNEAINETISQTKIYPLTKKSIHKPKIENCSLEEGAKISFSYETYPQVPVIDFTSISLPRSQLPPVADQEIQDVLEEICESRAQWEEIKDRAVAQGDYVDLNLEAIEGDQIRPLANKRRFHVADKKMGRWMQKAIIGKNVGDVVEEDSQPDDAANDEIKANFKKTRVRLTILGIFQAQLPELTEDFANQIGAPSLDALKKRIKEDLERESLEKQKEERYETLKEILLEKYVFEIPQTLMNEERKERLDRKIKEFRAQNLSEDEIKKQISEIEGSLLEDARKALSLYFLTRQIVEQGKLEVTSSEINQFLPRFNLKNIRDMPENMLNNLSNSLLQRKLKEYALSQVSG